MEHIAQGKRSDTLGFPHSRVSAPCKGKSFNPLCCYSYLIADLAVLKWNIVCIFCSIPAPCLKAFALTGRDCSDTRYPGCRFACPGLSAVGLSGRTRLNSKLELFLFLYISIFCNTTRQEFIYILAFSQFKRSSTKKMKL